MLDKHLHHQIITNCGDANSTMGTKHLDPALCLYLGAYLMCIDNKHLKDKVSRGNVTLCRVLEITLKDISPSYKCKTITERKCGQYMQYMLNGWNEN